MKLIDAESRRQAWKHFSTIGLLILAALPLAWAELSPEIKASLPEWARDAIHILIALWALGGKFVIQKPRAPRRRKS